MFYRILSRLLDYPDEELYENLEAVSESLGEVDASAEERAEVTELLAWMRQQTLLELQAQYVQTFDTTPEHSLHLTHHDLGDSRERGPALVDLGEYYKSQGVVARRNELPDYLPLVLEYASMLEPLPAQLFLGEARRVLVTLAGNLERAGSRWAALVRIAAERGALARSIA